MTCRRHLVTGRTMSAWSRTSCTAPTFLPIWPREIWPAIMRTGEERAYAVARPEAALYMPTPGTTNATPGFPDTRE